MSRKEKIIEQNLIENYDKYYRLAYNYVHNETDAMDIVQEGAYKAILQSNSLKKEAYVGTWIYRIMINEAISYIRKNKKEVENITEVQLPAMDTYHDLDLEKTLETLETLDKTIITLRFFEEFKLEQIAEATNENISTIKSRLYRALKKLKISLSEQEV